MADGGTVEERAELSLRIYRPDFSRIDLRCGSMPGTDETEVVFCAEAAFTEALLDHFEHSNIDGNHVSGGIWYEGAPCPETPERVGCTGAVIWYHGTYEFVHGTELSEQALLRAADGGGMGFMQETIIHRGKYVSNTRAENRRYDKMHYYRVLAELDGRLCVIEGTVPMLFSAFVPKLQELKVQEALYMDMGSGWNHSWYRDASGKVHVIFPRIPKSSYCTNWITFYR